MEVRHQSVQELYPDDPPDLQAIVAVLRDMVNTTIPGAIEIFCHASLGYGPTTSCQDRVIYIMVQRGWVNLGFFFGDRLTSTLVEGSGKRMRHVKVRTEEEARNPELAKLVLAAWHDGIERLPKRKTSGASV